MTIVRAVAAVGALSLVVGVTFASAAPTLVSRRGDPFATVYARQTATAKANGGGSLATTEPTAEREAPVSLGGGLEVLYLNLVDDGYGNVMLLGEIRNTGPEAFSSPHVRYTLSDASENVVGSIDARSVLPLVEVGQTVPIEGFLGNAKAAEVASKDAVLCQSFGGPDSDPSAGLDLRGIDEQRHDATSLVINGQVFNETDASIGNVSVLVLAYGADGRYVGSDRTLLTFEIPPKRSGRFSFLSGPSIFHGLHKNESYTYKLWVGIIPGITTYQC